MNKVKQMIAHAEKHCKTNGSRLTNKRKQVLIGLLQSEKALSAYELIDLCRTKFGETLQAMSMYRILDFLQSEQLVHKLNLANKYIACAHIICDHEHFVSQFLICDECQKVKEIRISKSSIAELEKSVEHAGFHLVSPQLEMNCICENCMANVA